MFVIVQFDTAHFDFDSIQSLPLLGAEEDLVMSKSWALDHIRYVQFAKLIAPDRRLFASLCC